LGAVMIILRTPAGPFAGGLRFAAVAADRGRECLPSLNGVALDLGQGFLGLDAEFRPIWGTGATLMATDRFQAHLFGLPMADVPEGAPDAVTFTLDSVQAALKAAGTKPRGMITVSVDGDDASVHWEHLRLTCPLGLVREQFPNLVRIVEEAAKPEAAEGTRLDPARLAKMSKAFDDAYRSQGVTTASTIVGMRMRVQGANGPTILASDQEGVPLAALLMPMSLKEGNR
jgi:hypothetical protein